MKKCALNNPITKAIEAALAKDVSPTKEPCEQVIDITNFRKTPAYHLHLPILQAGALLEDALNMPLPKAAQEATLTLREKLLEAHKHLLEADRLTRRMLVLKEKRGPKQDEERLEAMHRYIREGRHLEDGHLKSLNNMSKELDVPRTTLTRFLAEHYEELFETCCVERRPATL